MTVQFAKSMVQGTKRQVTLLSSVLLMFSSRKGLGFGFQQTLHPKSPTHTIWNAPSKSQQNTLGHSLHSGSCGSEGMRSYSEKGMRTSVKLSLDVEPKLSFGNTGYGDEIGTLETFGVISSLWKFRLHTCKGCKTLVL